ncbi:uracil-DNA glycosylase family protein [Thalassobius vesicularis]|uniref:Uracil-DNA glycosylase family protein n=1 Tax=Thalassobius vesicularis TaxID=1294297 RepID=A0A4S3ME42_9RHOB|nr:uracil-DNA glycosylase family protein [Thalassobius vesicularis]THD76960.1 uracil-DNA glycosylase family protein [Thalassobius vesicularis]
MTELAQQIQECRLCEGRFAGTATRHRPNPVVWFRPSARVLIAGQAPGMRVHETGLPFNDASGDRLRDWLGLGRDAFYDRDRVALVPMAFCFPGYDAKGSDLPPPKVCGQTWHSKVMESLTNLRMIVLVGGYSQSYHMGGRVPVTQRVAAWRDHAPRVFPLPHPSWRNTAWLRRNPWFEDELVPELRTQIQRLMND